MLSGTYAKTETRFYFVRHAHSAYEHGREYERGLSAEGRREAEKIRLRLESESIGVFVSSPYRRAIETIAPLAESAERSIVIHEDLRERLVSSDKDLGVEHFLEEKQRCYTDFDYRPAGGESSREAAERALNVIRSLLQKHAGERIAIGTHGDILTLILNGFDPEFDFGFWQGLSMPDVYCAFFENETFIRAERIRYG